MRRLFLLVFFITIVVTAIALPQNQQHTQVFQISSRLNIQKIFSEAPFTYFVLSLLSVSACAIWLYLIFTLSISSFIPARGMDQIKKALKKQDIPFALKLAENSSHDFSKILATALLVQDRDVLTIMETMSSGVRRIAQGFWQRVNLLNEIATIAPLIGLLGTVVGMLYGFYGFNRSSESLLLMLDGMGVAVGTTVGGLVVAIFATFLHMSAKYRLLQILAALEREIEEISLIINESKKVY